MKNPVEKRFICGLLIKNGWKLISAYLDNPMTDMSGIKERMEYHISKNRLETMVDGIFAIAMTILVLGINPPKPDISLAQQVLPGQIFDLVPEILIFIIAFLILAGFWLDHHHHFNFVCTVDSCLLWINIFLLISLIFIPFSTDVAGDYPDVQVAVLLFHINILIVGFIFSYHLHYISKSTHLLDPKADRKTMRVFFHQSLMIPGIAFIAAIISIANPTVSLLVYLTVPFVKSFVYRFSL